jgi:cation transport ATPase
MFCRRHQEFAFLRGLRIEWGLIPLGGICNLFLQLVGAIAVADTIKPSSITAIRQMHAEGLRVVMLTGDNRRVADAIAGEAGVDEVLADVLPVRRWR